MKFSARFLLALLVTSLVTAPGHAATATQTLDVSVAIRPWVNFQLEQNVHSYAFNREDIARGYVDVPNAMRLRVKSNERKPVGLLVRHQGPGTLLLKESSGSSYSGPDRSFDMGRQTPGIASEKTIDCRVLLPEDSTPGTYPLTLLVSLQSQ